LECIGVTIHLAVARVDAGPILARVKPKLQLGDTYYTITNRLIRESIDALPSAALRYLSGNIVPLVQVSNGERVWRKTDFSEVALRRALSIAGLGLTVEQIACIESSEKCHCSQ
jgi:methionyl-tRNA formyltransferase